MPEKELRNGYAEGEEKTERDSADVSNPPNPFCFFLVELRGIEPLTS
jgi:hypothetical protein